MNALVITKILPTEGGVHVYGRAQHNGMQYVAFLDDKQLREMAVQKGMAMAVQDKALKLWDRAKD